MANGTPPPSIPPITPTDLTKAGRAFLRALLKGGQK
ncbi:hypothetical protein F4556_007602 [Kitasatospora gansuensis]|uniref:Uncharacterized protein n=1 Tax=Kitasatospora gansuensis TaxID=258050 RepID=A0A7W7SK38_9ACTN|nr:hypothetical protein [Kitasatospora gansuensis]